VARLEQRQEPRKLLPRLLARDLLYQESFNQTDKL
jgi:hypothetical protein